MCKIEQSPKHEMDYPFLNKGVIHSLNFYILKEILMLLIIIIFLSILWPQYSLAEENLLNQDFRQIKKVENEAPSPQGAIVDPPAPSGLSATTSKSEPAPIKPIPTLKSKNNISILIEYIKSNINLLMLFIIFIIMFLFLLRKRKIKKNNKQKHSRQERRKDSINSHGNVNDQSPSQKPKHSHVVPLLDADAGSGGVGSSVSGGRNRQPSSGGSPSSKADKYAGFLKRAEPRPDLKPKPDKALTQPSRPSQPLRLPDLKIEVLTAPGVRRCGGDTDSLDNGRQQLAEDVAGVTFVSSNYLIAYIADGAPGPKREAYMNSRFHARILGQEVFVPWATEAIRSGKLAKPGEEEKFKTDIARRMEISLRESFASAYGADWPKIFKKRKNSMAQFAGTPGIQWQVSFTGIIYSIPQNLLYVYQLGDTAVYIESKKLTNSIDIDLATGANPMFTQLLIPQININLYSSFNPVPPKTLFYELDINNTIRETIENFNNVSIEFKFIIKPHINIFKNVQAFAILSDGIFTNKKKFEDFLKIQKTLLLSNNSTGHNTRRWTDMLRNLAEPSSDDKTIVIVTREKDA